MPTEKLSTITSTCVPLPSENVDTDQIIPARYLKSISRKGFGRNLFRDWRYDNEGKIKKDFVLNDSRYSGSILVAGKNFGTGSSREHAAWAIKDYGFRVVVSSAFADIFCNNALNNGLLALEVTEKFLEDLFERISRDPSTEVRVDLKEQYISVLPVGVPEKFEISPFRKECLLNGYDNVDYLLSIRDKIAEYENFSR